MTWNQIRDVTALCVNRIEALAPPIVIIVDITALQCKGYLGVVNAWSCTLNECIHLVRLLKVHQKFFELMW